MTLSISGYPVRAWDKGNVTKQIYPHTPAREQKGSVTIPYVAGLSEPLSIQFRKHGIATHHKPFNTL